jgi:hypothetical protein
MVAGAVQALGDAHREQSRHLTEDAQASRSLLATLVQRVMELATTDKTAPLHTLMRQCMMHMTDARVAMLQSRQNLVAPPQGPIFRTVIEEVTSPSPDRDGACPRVSQLSNPGDETSGTRAEERRRLSCSGD